MRLRGHNNRIKHLTPPVRPVTAVLVSKVNLRTVRTQTVYSSTRLDTRTYCIELNHRQTVRCITGKPSIVKEVRTFEKQTGGPSAPKASVRPRSNSDTTAMAQRWQPTRTSVETMGTYKNEASMSNSTSPRFDLSRWLKDTGAGRWSSTVR